MLVRKEYKKGQWRLAVIWSGQELGNLIKNFAGCLTFRGRSRPARRYYEQVLYALKAKHKKNPQIALRQAFDNLYPLFAGSQKRYGKKFLTLPSFATGNRRFVMVMNWLVRSQKGISNVRGYKIQDICRLIVEASDNRGKAIAKKSQFYKNVLSARHLLTKYEQEQEEDPLELTKRLLGIEEDEDDIDVATRLKDVKNKLPTYRSIAGSGAADDYMEKYAKQQKKQKVIKIKSKKAKPHSFTKKYVVKSNVQHNSKIR